MSPKSEARGLVSQVVCLPNLLIRLRRVPRLVRSCHRMRQSTTMGQRCCPRGGNQENDSARQAARDASRLLTAIFGRCGAMHSGVGGRALAKPRPRQPTRSNTPHGDAGDAMGSSRPGRCATTTQLPSRLAIHRARQGRTGRLRGPHRAGTCAHNQRPRDSTAWTLDDLWDAMSAVSVQALYRESHTSQSKEHDTQSPGMAEEKTQLNNSTIIRPYSTRYPH